jgi:RecA/RadA recombinase
LPHEGRRGNRVDPPAIARLPLAIPALDAVLGGGLPYGAITEVFGGVSSGRTTLAFALISAAMRAGCFTAWVDLPNALDPNCAQKAGIDLARLLWVCPSDRMMAVRVAEHVLDAGGFRVVVIDLDGATTSTQSVFASSVWLRMARAAVRRHAAVVLLAASHVAGTFATLSLEARVQRRFFVGGEGACPLFEGAASSLHLRKYKLGSPVDVPVDLIATTTA